MSVVSLQLGTLFTQVFVILISTCSTHNVYYAPRSVHEFICKIKDVIIFDFFLAGDIDQLKRFACGGFCDTSTIVYLQHPCVILTALEVQIITIISMLLWEKSFLFWSDPTHAISV